ncbi:NAD(P)/FAD-dependent oxidoreductase [Amycolatopsis sp. 195334CR]|uniref:FAD-dependent oxidoreductase n=1 Tax=Amycolatopsis sp. 195334CR TaxID=2814588 RepID=UPI001A8EA1F5|nr:NAD(P)/FAD-dependent oxidoreductase [Amycolatopsis sp. 195334CR]MBN6040322.1 FAD-dependent monooxygenase [Amycolatopsis sp. 195334CR]
MASTRVIIAGAGIGGLCLAQGLRRRGVDVAVFERDSGFDAQWSGYRLHLTGEANRALYDCLPLRNYLGVLAAASVPLDAFHLLDESLTELAAIPLGGSETLVDDDVMVSRRALRSMLLTGLDAEVHWGREVTGYRALPDNGVSVRLADGDEVEGTLLVGADGRASAVRAQLLPGSEPSAWPTRCVAGTTSLDIARTLSLPPPFLRGTGFVLGPGGGNLFFSYHQPSDPEEPYVLWAVAAPPDRWQADPRELGPGEPLRAPVLGLLDAWDPAAAELVAHADAASMVPLTFWAAPKTPAWPTSPSVTLLGDAIHVMPPTGGIGASTALCDAVDLADVIALIDRGLADPTRALGGYESRMLSRGRKAVAASTSNLRWAQRLEGPVAFRLGKFGLKAVTGTQNAFRSLAGRLVGAHRRAGSR